MLVSKYRVCFGSDAQINEKLLYSTTYCNLVTFTPCFYCRLLSFESIADSVINWSFLYYSVLPCCGSVRNLAGYCG